MICKTPSKVWHKVGASSGGDEVSEFLAYWIMRNRVKFIKRIFILKKITSFIILIFSRILVSLMVSKEKTYSFSAN